MLANVLTKSIRDRWTTGLVGALGVAILFWFSVVVYKDIDISFYYDMPRAVLDLMGIPESGGVAGIAFGAIYDLIGAFVLAGIAIGIGASSIAGEEADGTLGLLLGNPISRRGILISKAISMVVIVGAMCIALWGAGYLVPETLSVDMTGIYIGALILALFLNALVYGSIAMAIGAWTGSRNAASSTTVALMVVGYLAVGILPLIERADWLAKVFPWWYFNGNAPVSNGVNGTDTVVLISISVVAFIVAYTGVVRRDLKMKSSGVTLFDRLRANPRTQKVMERIAGSARVSRISVKTASEYQGLLTITGTILFYMGLMMPILYNFIPADFIDIFDQFPDALIAMVGGIDMGTAAGFLTGEIFSLVGPIALLSLMIVMGSRALAGEEEKHTMDLLLANPISRGNIVKEKAIAMLIYGVVFGVITFLGTWLGVIIAGLEEVTPSGIASVAFMLVLFGWVYGAMALAFGAGTGRTRVASLATTSIAVVSYFVFAFFPLSERFEPWSGMSPFTHYLGGDPLLNGVDWSDALILAITAGVLLALSVPLFRRRDLRG